METDCELSAQAYMGDAIRAIDCALRSIKYARSMQLPIIQQLPHLVRCRGELRVAKDLIDLLLMQLLAMDSSSSPPAESTAPPDSCQSDGAPRTGAQTASTECAQAVQDTAQTVTPYTPVAHGKEPIAGQKLPCSKDAADNSTLNSGGHTKPATHFDHTCWRCGMPVGVCAALGCAPARAP